MGKNIIQIPSIVKFLLLALFLATHSFFDFPLCTPSNAFFFLLLAAVAIVSIKTSVAAVRARHRRRSS